MEEQKYTQRITPPDLVPYPAEGRVDVAENIEEEECNAYSAHHKSVPSQGEDTIHKLQKGGDQSIEAQWTDVSQGAFPVEGRVDVAENVEEEQHNAYSAHHA